MTLPRWVYQALADLMLVMHAAFVCFVVAGLLLIWTGYFRQWAFVRNFWFRIAHLASIGIVALQAVSGLVCPLTTWENRLRLMAAGEQRYAGSFIEHWLHKVIFFDLDDRIFTTAYLMFFLAVALSFWLIPPRRPKRNREQ